MPNPIDDPTAYCMQAALSPSDPTLPATREGVKAIEAEIDRLNNRIDRLQEARSNILKRMKAA